MKTTRTGKALQLVESYRNREGKPRQRIVVSLGDLQVPEEHRRELARLVEDRLYGLQEPYLMPPDTSSDMGKRVDYILKRVEREGKWTPAKWGHKTSASGRDVASAEKAEPEEVIDGVVSNCVSHTHTTSLGPVLVGLHFWDKLGMPKLLESLGFNELQRKAATALVLNRLDDPVSEHAMPEWLAGSSLPDLLGDDLRRKADDIFYRTGDRLLERRGRIEAHLRRGQEMLFNLERAILLYDLTNTHFEGVCEANDKAVRGINKQKRNDCPQVVVGMVFDEFGFELAHQLLNAIIHTMSSAGDLRSWSTLKRILQTHCYTTMLLPTIDGKLHRIRRAGAAEAEQQKIYEILGVDHHNLPRTKMSVPMKNSSVL